MTDATAEETEEAPKSSKMPLIIGLVAGLLGAGGGFFATFSGMILAPPETSVVEEPEVELKPLADVAYVPLEPMVVTVGEARNNRHLRFRAQLEVPSQYLADVEAITPRILDIIHGYIRAVRIEDLEDSTALLRFRSHMLRRIDVVAGYGRVNDILIMEFVLN